MARISSEVRELAREISAVKRGLRDATVTPQLGRSSLDDESINTYDSDGNLRARYGLQHDGTYTAAVLDGPVPPVPSVPTVSGGPGELSVTWDGAYVDDARAPMDFHVVEVWAAENDFSDRSEARLLGHFANESGGDITVARPVGEWHVALVAKAQSGRRSAVSGRAVAVVESVVDQGALDELDDKLDQAQQDLAAAEGRIDAAEGQIAAAVIVAEGAQVAAAQAVADAAAAQTTAEGAQSEAETARAEAESKAAAAEAAAKSYAEAQAAAAEAAAIAEASGDAAAKAAAAEAAAVAAAALDASDKADAAQAAAEAKAADAQATADGAVQAAADAHAAAGVAQSTADAALTAAGSKTTITYSTSAPAGVGQVEGDTHRQRDAGNNIIAEWRWDGTQWLPQEVTSDMISNLDVGKLTVGSAEIVEVVAQSIAAATAAFIELDVENLFVTGTSTVDEQVAQAIWVAKLAAQKVLASEIATETLAADQGFIGVLNSAEIVGAVIKTAASGARVELDSGNGIRIFNSADELVLSADSDGNLVTGVSQSEKVRIAPTGITLSTTKTTPLATWPVDRVSIQFAVGHSRVYATAAEGNMSLDVYDLDGKKIDEWALGYRALSIAVSDDRVYVGSVSSNRVYAYNLNGVLQNQWSTPARPNSIAVEGNTVFVATGTSKSVEIYNLNGTPIRGFNTNKNVFSIDVVDVPGAGSRAIFVGSHDATGVDVYTEFGALWETIPTQRPAYDLTVIPSPLEPGYFEVYTLDYDRKQFDFYMVDLDDFYSVRIGRFDTAGRPSSINIFDNKFFVATSPERTVEVHSMPGTEHTTASLDSETGLLTTMSADLGGVTRTEALTPRVILPRGRTDNEDYAPTVEIVRPAFTQGLHVFEDETHRDLELPDPPDGTQAWTGTGTELVQWARVDGAWEAIHTGPHYLRIGDDGAPRLWADPVLVHGRDYSNAGPGADRNRVMVVTQFGTLGTLSGALDRDYLPYRIASGRVDITPSAANTPTSRTVTFPAGRFTATPDVLVAPITSVPGSTVLGAGHTGASASSCSVWLTRTNTTSTSVAWVAVQS